MSAGSAVLTQFQTVTLICWTLFIPIFVVVGCGTVEFPTSVVSMKMCWKIFYQQQAVKGDNNCNSYRLKQFSSVLNCFVSTPHNDWKICIIFLHIWSNCQS